MRSDRIALDPIAVNKQTHLKKQFDLIEGFVEKMLPDSIHKESMLLAMEDALEAGMGAIHIDQVNRLRKAKK